jgi:hypothetical protein
LLQNTSGVVKKIWLVVGIPRQVSSGDGMVTALEAAVFAQNRSGGGTFIWFLANDGSGTLVVRT